MVSIEINVHPTFYQALSDQAHTEESLTYWRAQQSKTPTALLPMELPSKTEDVNKARMQVSSKAATDNSVPSCP